MCGQLELVQLQVEWVRRLVLAAEKEVIETLASIHGGPLRPTDQVLAIVEDASGNRQLERLRWGLIPSWAKDGTSGTNAFNARLETAAEKPTFRKPFRSQRCVVIANGFFEWKEEPGRKKKVKHVVHRIDGEPMLLAGLWDDWKSPTGEVIRTVTILTREAKGPIATIHSRMPVIVAPAAATRWIDRSERTPEELHQLLNSELREAEKVSVVEVEDTRSLGPLFDLR